MQEPVISRRRVIAALMLAHALGMMQRTSMSVAQAGLSADFSLSATAFGLAASMYFYAYTLAQIPMGYLVDTVGPRRTSSAALFLVAAGSLLSSLTSSFTLLCLGRFVMGLGGASVFLSLVKIQSNWFRPDEFSTMSGIMQLVSNIGSLMAQYPLAFALLFISWRIAFSFLGLMALLLAYSIWKFVRDNPPHSPVVTKLEKRNFLSELKRILNIPRMKIAFTAHFLIQGPHMALMTVWGNSYIRETYGLDAATASLPAVFLVLGTMSGSLAAGFVVDLIGLRKPVIAVLTGLHLAAWGGLSLADGLPMWGMYVLFALMGFSAAAFIIYWTVEKELGPPESAGLIISIANMASFLSIALCSSVIGVMLDVFADYGAPFKYQAGFGVCFFLVLISLLLLHAIPETGPRGIAPGPDSPTGR